MRCHCGEMEYDMVVADQVDAATIREELSPEQRAADMR